jgi:hypothetical protein
VDIFPSISFNEIVPSLINLDISGNPMDTTLEDIDICNIYDDYFNT